MGRYCVKCRHNHREAITQNGRGMMVPFCNNPDYGDPVTGAPMPCAQVRSIEEYCGLKGKGFSMKKDDVEDAVVIEEKPRIIL